MTLRSGIFMAEITENILHEVRKLYRDAQTKFADASTKGDLTGEHYWTGKIDGLYAVLNLLQQDYA
jgi:hypothetical protein